MSHHTIEVDEECKSCSGTGLYVGICERDGAAVVCHTCKGTGCHRIKIEYDDFTYRKRSQNIERVFEINPGIVIGKGKGKYKLSYFGGMPIKDWLNDKPFPDKSENRLFTCPARWYQAADYNKKPSWEKCISIGSFSSCKHYANKAECWKRWDKENT